MMFIGPALLRHSSDGAPSSDRARPWLFAVLLMAMPQATIASAAPAPVVESSTDPWARVQIAPGKPVTTRPFPPKEGRNRCISVNGLAGAQLFGDRAIELTMRNGQHYRLFLARECPALSFYQGFYYKRQKAGQLCAGRDVIGARSGGECPIASIIAVRPLPSETKGKTSTNKRKR
jgi:hypothetical protein